MQKTYINSSLVDNDKAFISIYDRSVQYGDSIYEIVLIHNQKLVDFAAHIERLIASASKLHINIHNYAKSIKDESISLPIINRCDYGYLYIQVTRGSNPTNIDDFTNLTPTIIISTYEKTLFIDKINPQGARLFTMQDFRWHYRSIKVNSLVAATLARLEAKTKGYDDALFVNSEGNITEASRANVFIVTQDNVIVTPPLSENLLAGITRQRVLTLIDESDLEYEIREISLEEAQNAAEIFLTGSVSMVYGAACVNKADFTSVPGPITVKVHKLYTNFVTNSTLK